MKGGGRINCIFIMFYVVSRTYKCGHCGKTLPDSSEFHRHSALSHGDKIPDLVKDPEVNIQLFHKEIRYLILSRTQR